jgi:TATA-binding protein-associated factor Taf7
MEKQDTTMSRYKAFNGDGSSNQSNFSFEYDEGRNGLSINFNFSSQSLGSILEQFKNFLIASGYGYVDAVSAFSGNMEFSTKETEEDEYDFEEEDEDDFDDEEDDFEEEDEDEEEEDEDEKEKFDM